ncbi:MAG: hypothetical protein A2V93_07480 [Ignavibacteria bacterium RBG_16_34_14]|nr:MAG: hypothetical protein A2V93_07480 [Ignavibacteria bacterium RBG_16_34_14]
MKFFILTLLLLAVTFTAHSQNISGRFSSSVYTFERFDSINVSKTYARAYQLLSLNINKDKVSLRSYMNLETNLTKEQQVDHPRLRFYNLYLEARDLFDIATIKLGRQPQFNSVVGGVFDGVNLDLHKGDYKLSGFYGANIPAYQKLELIKNWDENYVAGAALTAYFLNNIRFEANYVKKNFKEQEYNAARLDEDLNHMQVHIRNKSNQYEFVSGELSYSLKNIVSIDTRYDYDLNVERTSKFEISGRYEQIENLGINVYYNFREPKVRYNSIFSVFDYGNSQEIEVGGDYRFTPHYTFIAKFANVTYETENSQRITGGFNTSWGSLIYRKNLGYAGELDAVSLYSAYSFFEGLITPSLGVSYTSYKLSKDDLDKNDLMSVLAGINYRPFRFLSFDLQGQYMNNKIYKDDYRFFFKLNYWFNENLNLM